MRNPSAYVRERLVELGGHANETMANMTEEAAKLAELIPEVLSIYDEKEQRILRTQESLPRDLAHKVMREVMISSALRFRAAKVTRAPTFNGVLDTLVFRESLCIYIWTIRTLKGRSPTNSDKIRNPVVDCSFAAYATFFDGLADGYEVAYLPAGVEAAARRGERIDGNWVLFRF